MCVCFFFFFFLFQYDKSFSTVGVLTLEKLQPCSSYQPTSTGIDETEIYMVYDSFVNYFIADVRFPHV